MRKHITVGTLVAVTAAVAWAGDCLHRTRVRNYCYLPCYEYRDAGQRPTNPTSEVSSPLIEIAVPAVGEAAALKGRTFQLSKSMLASDHCNISLVTLTIFDNGQWIVHFRATQDVNTVADETQRPRFMIYKRNRFHVSFRGEAAAEVEQSAETAVVAPPEFFKLTLNPFWVERGETNVVRLDGKSEEIRRFYSQISRVEADLQYE
jgi:hypothetical protein